MFRGIVFGGFKRRRTAVLYEGHRTLWAPIITHAMLNGVVSLPLFLAVVS